MNKDGIFGKYLVRTVARVARPGKKSPVRFYIDPNSNWYDFYTNVERTTIKGDSVLLRRVEKFLY